MPITCKCGRTLENPLDCPSLVPDKDGQSSYCLPFLHRVYDPDWFGKEMNRQKQVVKSLLLTDEDELVTIYCQMCDEPIEVSVEASRSQKCCPSCKKDKEKLASEIYRETHREELRQRQRDRTVGRQVQVGA